MSKNTSNKVDIKKLLEAGAHFGHKTSRWHPRMAPYIHSKRGGNHIIDLTQTVEKLEDALAFIEKTVANGKQVLLVGTKRQAKDIVKNTAEATGMPYVSERWLGGMLTNQTTMSGRIKHLKNLESKKESGELEAKYNKLEVQRFNEEIELLNKQYGGIKDMSVRPGVVFVFDVQNDANAVREANKLNIPIVGLVDSNVDPSDITYPIPANDDAIKTMQLIASYVQQAIQSGKAKIKQTTKDSKEDDKQQTQTTASIKK